ncbi:S-adenosyl-L-methionine-dependent methyltransferase [Phlyctochytrium arcticum]|nr:S-adenosyl-L-methionine-dependent methyltransferase [Phlyctochytrium arcticum]
MVDQQEIKALEFFSGIGGLHYGLEYAHPNVQVLASFDINQHANSCYEANFGIKPIQKGIQDLTPAFIGKFKANCWVMSPPCQPYTQMGKKLDDQDPRADGLLHLIEILDKVQVIPEYIFVENVPNFEVSRSREILVDKLDQLGYTIHEFLVSPTQFGMAGDRRRYYLTARRERELGTNNELSYRATAVIHTSPIDASHTDEPGTFVDSQPPQLSEYLEDLQDETPYFVPDSYIMKRHKFRFDIVKPSERKCSCFTKAYGSHHVIGSGSFLHSQNHDMPYDFDDPSSLLPVKFRFFTPTEVARLHAFPIEGEQKVHRHLCDPEKSTSLLAPKHPFVFPRDLSTIQKWRLLGNSLNCRVVGSLMRKHLFA